MAAEQAARAPFRTVVRRVDRVVFPRVDRDAERARVRTGVSLATSRHVTPGR